MILEDHFMVYIQMVMTAEKATKLGYDHITRLEACFVVVLLIFNNVSALDNQLTVSVEL